MGEEEECNVRKDTIWVIGTLAQSTLPRPSGRRGGSQMQMHARIPSLHPAPQHMWHTRGHSL